MAEPARVAPETSKQTPERAAPTAGPDDQNAKLKRSLVGQSYDDQVAALTPPPEGKSPVKKGAGDKSTPTPATEPEKTADPEKDEAEIAPPETLSQKSAEGYFNQMFAAEFQAKGQFEKFISLKISKYKSKSKPDKGVAPVGSLAEVWAKLSGELSALRGDMRTFASTSVLQTMLPAKGRKPAKEAFITIRTDLYRRPVTKAEDKALAATMVPIDSGMVKGGGESIAPETYDAYKALYAAIPAHLLAKDPNYGKVTSGFRDTADQQTIFTKALAKNTKEGRSPAEAEKITRKWVAKPGTSAHNTGHAVDLWMGIGNTEAKAMAKSKKSSQYKKHGEFWEWLIANAPSFGFLPYSPEPWHWEKWK